MIGLTASLVLQISLLGGGAEATYTEAYRASQQSGRPLLVLVGADWCPACRTMKQGVISRMVRGGKLGEVEFAQVNTDRESRLAGQLMRGGSIPQLIMYHQTADGWQRTQLIGAQSEATVERLIQTAVRARPATIQPAVAETSLP